MTRKENLRTVHLGQFDRVTANEIAGELEEAEIVWWYKEPGFFSQIWEHGVRLFVDGARLAEAEEIAGRVRERLAAGEPPRNPGPHDR